VAGHSCTYRNAARGHQKISRAVAQIVAEPDVIARLAPQGGGPAGTAPKVFERYLKGEIVKWLTLNREVNISAT
jgi:tripartite-type tricarboxylate transporter receptor subunit TctC